MIAHTNILFRLPEVIAKYSQRKPIIIFCFTRNSTVSTAKFLANWWSTNSLKDKYWEAPKKEMAFIDNEIRSKFRSVPWIF